MRERSNASLQGPSEWKKEEGILKWGVSHNVLNRTPETPPDKILRNARDIFLMGRAAQKKVKKYIGARNNGRDDGWCFGGPYETLRVLWVWVLVC